MSTVVSLAAVPALGLHARAAYALPFHLLVALDVLADAPLVQGSSSVEGEPGQAVKTPVIDLTATLQVGVGF